MSSTAGSRLTRRRFVKTATLGTAALTWPVPAVVRGQNLNEKLNLAVIGTGGRGGGNLESVASENIVALCDVNEYNLAAAADKYPSARRFADFRDLYNFANEFDAVVVSTCEHTHAFATLPALQLGKHVYCEKPLTYNVWEARVIREAAAKAGVATQMGTQIHAGDNYRRVVELIQTGAIGPVREVHVWVSARGDGKEVRRRPNGTMTSCWSRIVPPSRNRSRPISTGTSGLDPLLHVPFTASISPDRSGTDGGTSATGPCRIWEATGSISRFGR